MSENECFVIMPFNKKEDRDGSIIDFETIYDHLIEPAILNVKLVPIRSDKIDMPGMIHPVMFRKIYEAPVAIADITSLNPNVFYELGLRHALADRVTVLLRRKGTPLPFNIQGAKFIEYDEKDIARTDRTKKEIGEYIQNGINAIQPDSPAHIFLGLKVNREAVKIAHRDTFDHDIKDAPGKKICLVTDDLQNLRNIADIWVSSENTNMEMSRPFERSVSGVIRYLGSKRNESDRTIEDTVARALRDKVGENAYVTPGKVIPTVAGELTGSHGVKLVFHAAAVHGQVGIGYVPIADIGRCVTNALHEADKPEHEKLDLRSILFPLIGTGQGRGSLEAIAPQLLGAAVSYLHANRNSRIEKVYFITWSDRQLDVCRAALRENKYVAMA